MRRMSRRNRLNILSVVDVKTIRESNQQTLEMNCDKWTNYLGNAAMVVMIILAALLIMYGTVK